MKKETIEYFRDKNNLRGYSYLTKPKQLQESSILDFLCQWSKGKNITIYSHSLKRIDENDRKDGCFFSYGREVTKEEYDAIREGYKYFIPYCDWVFYLDIYYQNNC